MVLTDKGKYHVETYYLGFLGSVMSEGVAGQSRKEKLFQRK